MGNSFPGIEGRALIVIDSHPAVGELDGLGFSEEDHSGPGQALNGPGIRPGHGVLSQAGAGGGGDPPNVKKVLDRVGNAAERPGIVSFQPGLFGLPGLFQCPFRSELQKGF